MFIAQTRPNQWTSWAAPTPQMIRETGMMSVVIKSYRRCSGFMTPPLMEKACVYLATKRLKLCPGKGDTLLTFCRRENYNALA